MNTPANTSQGFRAILPSASVVGDEAGEVRPTGGTTRRSGPCRSIPCSRGRKWRKRATTADAPIGPKEPRATVRTIEEAANSVAFRRHTLRPLDDCLYGLQPTIPHLTRFALHRCLERRGISRRPEVAGDKPRKQRFASYAIGYVHIDIAEASTAGGKLRLFVAIDRTSKLAFARLVESAGKMEGAQFLRDFIEAAPCHIHTVLTDNRIQFTSGQRDIYDNQHIFDRACDEHGIELCLTEVNHPWTNGQVERMNRTIKDATVKRDQGGAGGRGEP